jgi:hypothetical protein
LVVVRLSSRLFKIMKYFDNISACGSFYNFTLPACPDSDESFVIKAGLTPATLYYWYIEDKFSNVYTGSATTDVSGFLSIPLADFPEAYFNEYAGTFILWLQTSISASSPVNLTFSGTVYECISLSFVEMTGNESLVIQ